MAQQINVPGVGVLSFPDGMSDSDISAAIHKNFPQVGSPPGAAKATVGDIPKDPGQYSNTYFDIPSMSLKERPNDGLDTFMEGLGRHLAATVTGGKQLAQKIGNKVGLVDDSTVAQTQKDVDSAAVTDRPLLKSTPGMLGNAAGSGAVMSLIPGGVAASAAGGAVDQGSQPVATDDSGNLVNAAEGAAGGAAGALLGKGVGALAGRIVQPIRNALSGAQTDAVSVLRANGIPMSAAQQTGSRVLKTAENAAGDSPLVGPSELPEAQASAFTKAALKYVGVTSDTASPTVMGGAKRVLGQTYDAVAARNTIAVDLANPTADPLLGSLDKISLKAKQSLVPEQYSVIRNQLDNVVNAIKTGKGQINGTQYQNIQQDLDLVAGDGGKQPFVTDIRQALTNALRRSSSPQDAALLADTDRKYQALKQIQGAIGPDNKVSPNLLYNSIDTVRNANQSVYGSGPQGLAQLAQAGKQILGAKTPNSGTGQRIAGMALFGAAGGIADSKVHGGGVETPLVTLAASLGGPALARQVLENPRVANAIAKWAANKGLLNFGATAKAAGTAAGGTVGAAATPAIDTSADPNSQDQTAQ